LKSTVNLVQTSQSVKFDLDVKNYNDLRKTEVGTARILIVVDLHSAKQRWLRANEKHLVFDRCAYWLSLYGAPETTNKNTVRVDIPRSQVLTPAELERIIELRHQRIQGQHGGL
jgi:hypothetical protein